MGVVKNEPTVYDQFTEDIKFTEGRYEVKLPFKSVHPLIPDNFVPAKSRLESLVGRLRSKPDIMNLYDDIIREQNKENIVEVLVTESVSLEKSIISLTENSCVQTERRLNSELFMTRRRRRMG